MDSSFSFLRKRARVSVGAIKAKSGPSCHLEMQVQVCILVLDSSWETPGFAFQGLRMG